MMIDDDTLKQLLRINDGLFQLCKQLTDKRDIETSSRLIPLVDDLTHILIDAGKEQATVMQPYKGYFITSCAMPVHPFDRDWYVGGSVLVPGPFHFNRGNHSLSGSAVHCAHQRTGGMVSGERLRGLWWTDAATTEKVNG